jgi:NAD(P)-dependent dehydrogenase (short-subunit alcohol dehydrogenase family)
MPRQIERTFRTHVLSFFVISKYALRRMGRGGSIINTTLTTAYQGHKTLLDYSATKGTVVVMTRSLSEALVGDGIRVNAVAPGPMRWRPVFFSRQRGRVLHQRAGAASERWQRGRFIGFSRPATLPRGSVRRCRP